jgi:hypothetical protein
MHKNLRREIIKRITTARSYRDACTVLDEKVNAHLFGPTSPVLSALALEIYLKALCELDNKKSDFGHNVEKGWETLGKTTQDAILDNAKPRFGPHADFSDMSDILKTVEFHFKKYRYDYELKREHDTDPHYELKFFPNEITSLHEAIDEYISQALGVPKHPIY